tara:strand:+ start:5613 stop:6608 length:996 start_codon:yes stop_codon:yes gene_type:complete
MNLKYLSDIELLNTKVRDLDLNIDTPFIQIHIQKLMKELRARGVDFPVRFWLGDEWCSPEGSPGVSIPFCLSHPRLIRLENQYVGFNEGKSSDHFMKLIRHEVGHAIETAFGIDRHPLRELVFGSTDEEYPSDYKPDKRSKDFVRHLPDHYAQAHPDEDFAETFAVWLTPKTKWREKYKKWPALDKLKVMEMLMTDVSEMAPVKTRVRESFHYKKMNMTLLEYFRIRFNHYHPHMRISKHHLQRVFSLGSEGPTAKDWIRDNSKWLEKKLGKQISNGGYNQRQSLKTIQQLTDKWRLRMNPSEAKNPKEVLDFVAKFSLQLSQRDYTKVIM